MTGTSPSKPWFLYLLECAGGRIYTGITVDVQARYAAHVAGKGARFTRAHPPSRILLSMDFADRSAASRAEYRVKQLSATQKRALIAGTFAVDLGVSDAAAPPKTPRRRKVTAPDVPVE
ncbi:GIY-YIG nuclease superfamily protein [Pandoraea iniqua]|uniref:GIY-YIG nuclease superfamily protein n=1 Tax=Pandoraea iniqua TaxID=2508288 RepID=A0A5E4RCQ7_9BURK|nr:GIY-YIG nuclease family protein [Pandoraea iniqua]VVD59869.1 GIY-YIG nuclease superfamily protein [Pandoraea iniqua]